MLSTISVGTVRPACANRSNIRKLLQSDNAFLLRPKILFDKKVEL